MGGGRYESNITRSYLADTAFTGRTMAHAAAVANREVEAKVHALLDPKRPNREGIVIRESLDSEEHPNSVPVAIFFDTTGSMASLPLEFIRTLPDLMDLIIEKKILADPQILFGAINDASSGSPAPLEVGQFESGNQMDDALSNILVSQGGGGAGITESYELAMYFMARKSKLDCLDKRNKKGYMFIIGDEIPYPDVNVAEVKTWIGDDLQANIPVATILEELKRKFEVFWIYPDNALNAGVSSISTRLSELFGQRLIHLKSTANLCPTIAAAIAVNEGQDPRAVKALLEEGLKSIATANEIDAIVASIPPRNLDDI